MLPTEGNGGEETGGALDPGGCISLGDGGNEEQTAMCSPQSTPGGLFALGPIY